MFVPLTNIPLELIDECEVSPVCVRPEGLEPPTDQVGVFQNTSTPGPSEQRFF